MPAFRPPRDWETVFASNPDAYFFGEEPSQIARTALQFFRTFGGDPAQSIALDLGCGEGRDTAFLAAAGFRVVARDIAPAGLAKTAALLEKRGLAVDRVEMGVGDVQDFAYPEDAYDLALAANVYQFVRPADVPGHIARLQGTTKTGGLCAVGVFSPAMLTWGAELAGLFTATPEELMAFFPAPAWRLLDRTEYWTYRPPEDTMASFAYVVARKVAS